jgi:hypothetical protein
MYNRQTVAQSGWKIIMERGEDIYKWAERALAFGLADFVLRPCCLTTVLCFRLRDTQCR